MSTKLFTLVSTKKGKETVYMTDVLPKVKARKKTLETSQRKLQMNYSIRPANEGEVKYQRPPSFNFCPSGDAGSAKYIKRKARAKRIKQKNPRKEVLMAVEKVGQDETQKLQATCKNCGAVLEFYRKDVKSQGLYSMGEYDGSYDYVDCPECKQQVTVKC